MQTHQLKQQQRPSNVLQKKKVLHSLAWGGISVVFFFRKTATEEEILFKYSERFLKKLQYHYRDIGY